MFALFPVGGRVSVVTAQESGNTGLSFCAEQNIDAGTLTAPQLPMLALQCNLEDSNSINTTMQGKDLEDLPFLSLSKCMKL